MDRAFDGAEIILADVLRKARFWEKYAGEPFNARQRLMLNRLLDGIEGKLTSSKWAKMAKCSQDTAGRDIEDLIERNVLQKETAGGRSTNYSLIGDFIRDNSSKSSTFDPDKTPPSRKRKQYPGPAMPPE